MIYAPRTVVRLILLLWVMHGVLSYLFTHTHGLVYLNADSASGISLVSELESSGGNDNICIEIGVVFAAIAVVWGGLRIKTQFGLADLGVNFVLVGLQALYILSIEVGSVLETVVSGNSVLTIWLLCYVTLFSVLLCLFLVSMICSRNRRRKTDGGGRRESAGKSRQ